MPPRPVTERGASSSECVEIFCDESGSEGERLVGGTTDVFAHASVVVEADVAAAWLAEVRLRARSPAEEVKASVVLREQNRGLLADLLGPQGPYAGGRRALVHLTDKRLHLVGAMVTLLGSGEPGDVALAHRDGPGLAGRPWEDLLASFNDLLRARTVVDARARAASFRRQALALASALDGTSLGGILARAAACVPADDSALLELLGRRRPESALDPLVPALAAAIGFWGAGGRRVQVVHDEQRTLREAGYERLVAMCGPDGALAGIRFVDSRHDARVQLADFLAGAARRLASDLLAGRPDEELVTLLEPYVATAGGGRGAPPHRWPPRDAVRPRPC